MAEDTVQGVVDAALVAVEQRSGHGFNDTEEAKALSEDQFWESVDSIAG